jgi:ribulose-phosphate 3-epimerase
MYEWGGIADSQFLSAAVRMKPKHLNPWEQFRGDPLVAPSLLACDFMRMGEQIAEVRRSGARLLHADIMDGHFVPNLALSPGIVRSVRAGSDAFIDVHLMVTDPLFFVEPFLKAGATSITFHVESQSPPQEVIDRLRAASAGVGIVMRPRTPARAIAQWVDQVDLVLIMTVEPGFGGQEFMDDQLEKVRAVRDMAGPAMRVVVDGGINVQTGARCRAAGADTFVAGVNIFGAPDSAEAFRELQEAVK